jgi:hypothetical protein
MFNRTIILWGVGLLCGGCYGESNISVKLQAPPPVEVVELTPVPKVPAPVCGSKDLAPTVLRRLTKYEFNRTASDLLGAPIAPGRTLPDEATHFGFSNNADGHTIDPALFERYEAASLELATAVVRPPASATRRLPTCDVAGKGVEACARTILTGFAKKAWRRPVSGAELDKQVGLVTMATTDGETWEAALTLGVQAVLLSPNFLFRVEVDPLPRTEEPTRLSGYELATRLSYFLWGSMPDEVLLAAAEIGSLETDEGIQAQARRMLADPRSSSLTETFGNEWLEVSAASAIAPNATLFPGIDAALKSSMRKETELVFKEFLNSDRSYRTIFTADFTFMNNRLASHYGLPPVGSDELARVQLTDSKRGGILKQAGFLSITSAPNRTSIVKRGEWVLSRLLCEQLAFPDNVAAEFAKNPKPATTLREQLEQHRTDPACSSCHKRMDPIGFGLENYDAVGRWRDMDNGVPIDAHGQLPPAVQFNGPTELAHLLAKDPRVTQCAVQNMTTFALGRSLRPADKCAVDRMTYFFDERGSKLSDLVLLIATSYPFTHRLAAKESL